MKTKRVLGPQLLEIMEKKKTPANVQGRNWTVDDPGIRVGGPKTPRQSFPTFKFIDLMLAHWSFHDIVR